MGLFSSSSLGASIIGSSVAWYAANKALGFLPEDWQNAISGNQSQEILDAYLDYNNQGEPIADDADILNTMRYGSEDYYGISSTGNAVLQLIGGTEDILVLPFCNGYPIIKQAVIPNELPIASNMTAGTTNRRKVPTEWRFQFPIQYLRIYGVNNSSKEIVDARDWTQKVRDTYNEYNPIGFLDVEANDTGQQRERSLPTYAQVVNKLLAFGSQFGCYLYMGFGSPKYLVTCSLEIQSPKDIQAINVSMTLTHTQQFDMGKLTESASRFNGMDSFYNTNAVSYSDTTTSITQTQ